DREDAQRDDRQDPVLAAVPVLPRHLPGAALAGRRGLPAPLRRLPARRRVHDAEPDLLDLVLRPGRLHPVLLLERLHHREEGADGGGRRPVGPRLLPGVGDLLPAAAAQLHVVAADPFGASGLRPQPPARHAPERHRPAVPVAHAGTYHLHRSRPVVTPTPEEGPHPPLLEGRTAAVSTVLAAAVGMMMLWVWTEHMAFAAAALCAV